MSDSQVAAIGVRSTEEKPLPGSLEAASRENGVGRRTLKTALRLLITFGVLVLLFRQVHWSEIWSAFSVTKGSLFWAACALWLPTQWLQFRRWDLLASTAGEEVRRSDIHRGYWVGFTLGLITPGRIGEYGRALALHNCSLARAVGVSILERTYSGIVMNGTGLVTLAVLSAFAGTEVLWLNSAWIRAALIIAGTAILAFGLRPGLAYGPLSRIACRLPGSDKIHRALEVLKEVSGARGFLLLSLAIGALASSLLQYALLLWALGAKIGIVAAMLAALLTFFIKGALPLTIGSLGIAEWAAVVVFGYFGVEPATAVAASLLLFATNVFIPGLIGLPFLSGLRLPSLAKSVKPAV